MLKIYPISWKAFYLQRPLNNEANFAPEDTKMLWKVEELAERVPSKELLCLSLHYDV